MTEDLLHTPALGPEGEPEPAEPVERIPLGGRSLRELAARGTLVNFGFEVALVTLVALRGFVVAALLTRSEYGLWGVIVLTVGALYMLRDAGIGAKYVQQDEADQELAFQHAFTLEMILSGAFSAALLALTPLIAVLYGHHELVGPLLVIATLAPAAALYSPLWIFYRRMQFVHQRALQAIEPVVGFVVTVTLAALGAGYWSLVIGTAVSVWCTAIASVIASPYRIRFRYDRESAREYFSFSWPVFVSGVSRAGVVGGSILAATKALGLAGAGAITLASSITQYTNRVDTLLTSTMYPAICAVRDRVDVLFESFVKSNRLTLMWGVPFGVGVTLFAPDLVNYVLGRHWRPAIGLIEAFGILAAVNHVGFNWAAYFQARGQTRPLAVVSVIAGVSFLATGVPLLFSDGLSGFAVGMAISTGLALLARSYYLTRLFSGFQMLKHGARAVVPVLPAVAAVLLLRMVESGHRTAGMAIAEFVVFVAVTAVATWAIERDLLREAVGYLRGTRPAGASA